jgi:hypothetical protein
MIPMTIRPAAPVAASACLGVDAAAAAAAPAVLINRRLSCGSFGSFGSMVGSERSKFDPE